MRTYGRIFPTNGDPPYWVKVEPDANGQFDFGYITTLAQVLQLNRGESPFYADYGIPAQQSVMSQVPPDYYMAVTQQQFANFFAALTLAKVADDRGQPHYRMSVTTNQGVSADQYIPIPQ